MTPDEQAKIDAVTVALIGEMRIGAHVEKLRDGRRGVIIAVREKSKWVRVKFDDTGGHWEFNSDSLRLI